MDKFPLFQSDGTWLFALWLGGAPERELPRPCDVFIMASLAPSGAHCFARHPFDMP